MVLASHDQLGAMRRIDGAVVSGSIRLLKDARENYPAWLGYRTHRLRQKAKP